MKNKNILENELYLRLTYIEFKQLHNLLEAYCKVDPNSLPGMTGDKVMKLRPIFKKFSDKLKEAEKLQLKLTKTLEDYFEHNKYSVSGGYGTEYLKINNYYPNTSLLVILTVEEVLALYYYVNLFKRMDSVVGDFGRGLDMISKKFHVKDNVDNLIEAISKSILTRLPNMVLFNS
jgi:hypothetical protein